MLTSQGGFVGGHTLYKLISVCTHSNIDLVGTLRTSLHELYCLITVVGQVLNWPLSQCFFPVSFLFH